MRVDPNYVQNLSLSLDASEQTQANLTAELSSGLRVANLSTDPTVTSESALLNTAISKQDSFVQVATTETGRLQVADSTLGEAVTQLTTAISLATQAANGTLNSANLSSIQQEASGIRDSIVSLANTAYTGTYLFAGSKGTTVPYSSATAAYAGDSKVQSISTPAGQSVQVGLAGDAVFGPVLSALNTFIADLGTGTASAVSQDSANLSAALKSLSAQRTTLDGSLSLIQSTSSYAQTQEANLKVTQSGLVSADTAQVSTQLSAATTQHQALLNVYAALNKNNLFDYLQ